MLYFWGCAWGGETPHVHLLKLVESKKKKVPFVFLILKMLPQVVVGKVTV